MQSWSRDCRGAIGVIAAISLTGLLGSTALVVDLGRGYEQRMVNQRAADMAALGAAIAFKASNQEAILQPTAEDIALANGLSGATVTAVLVNNFPAAGSRAVRVTINTPVRVALARAIGMPGSYTVGARATADLGSGGSSGSGGQVGCIIALGSSGNAVETQGGATINASGCSITAVGSIANNGTSITADKIVSGSGDVINNYGTITANSIKYAGNFTNPAWNNNVPASDKRTKGATTVVDPLADNADLAAARALIGTSDAPVLPAVTGTTAWSFGSGAAPTGTSKSGNTFTVPARTEHYLLTSLDVAGGYTVNFAAGAIVNVSGNTTIGGGAFATFGDGNMTFRGAFSIAGGSNVTMGAGNHAFGSISIGGGSWMKLGEGNLDVSTNVVISGDSTLATATKADGSSSYRLGNGSGNAIDLAGSARFLMGDGAFSVNGSINTAGGSRLVFGRAANHKINGNMTIGGSVLFGAGRYTMNGTFTNGVGGTTWPYTSPVNGITYGNTLEGVSVSGFDQAGVNVTFILNGMVNLAGGAKTKLIAPTTTTGGGMANILIDSLTNAAVTWGAGAQSIFVGAVHLPNSAVTTSGGATALGDGQCFMLIVNRFIASGGGTAATSCPGIGSGGGAEADVGLIQ